MPPREQEGEALKAERGGELGYIWSGEHNAYWRSKRTGYTARIKAAGLYTRAEAEAIMRGVGPEKRLEFEAVRSAPASGEALRDGPGRAAGVEELIEAVCKTWPNWEWNRKLLRQNLSAVVAGWSRPLRGPAADAQPDVCEHGIRKPWACAPCDDVAWARHRAPPPPGAARAMQSAIQRAVEVLEPTGEEWLPDTRRLNDYYRRCRDGVALLRATLQTSPAEGEEGA